MRPHGFHHAAAQTQAQPHALRLCAPESIKHMLGDGCWQAYTAVLYGQLHLLCRQHRRRHLHGNGIAGHSPMVYRFFHSIGSVEQQIAQHLLQLQFVSPHMRQCHGGVQRTCRCRSARRA